MEPFKCIIAGGRDFSDYELVKTNALRLLQNKLPNVQIISGGATGADALGERFAKENNLDLLVLPAEWEKYGRSAGPIRNRQMAEIADGLIAFWDGNSKGTKNMIDTATQMGLHVKVIKY